MKQNDKYFGMSAAQIGILAGLAGAACLLFGLAGWFLLRGNFTPLAPVPQNTPVLQATATPFLLPTLAPTLASTETPTPVPYDALVPEGWQRFKTALIEIWLPIEFKLGDPQLIRNPASSATQELVLTGVTSKTALYQMLVFISYEPLMGSSLDDFLDLQIANYPSDFHVAERRKVSINSKDAVQLVFETRKNNVDLSVLAYVFLDGGTVWYVEYGAQINDFYGMLPSFEQSVKTFRVGQ